MFMDYEPNLDDCTRPCSQVATTVCLPLEIYLFIGLVWFGWWFRNAVGREIDSHLIAAIFFGCCFSFSSFHFISFRCDLFGFVSLEMSTAKYGISYRKWCGIICRISNAFWATLLQLMLHRIAIVTYAINANCTMSIFAMKYKLLRDAVEVLNWFECVCIMCAFIYIYVSGVSN